MDFLFKSISGHNGREYNTTLMFATHSPYIINYLNVLLLRDELIKNNQSSIGKDDLSVYRVYQGSIQNLVGTVNGNVLVNTSDLSEEIERIYYEYQ